MLYRLLSVHVASDGMRYPPGSYLDLDEHEASALGSRAVPVGEGDAGIRSLRDYLKSAFSGGPHWAGPGTHAFRDPELGLILVPNGSFREAIGDRDPDRVRQELAHQRYFPFREARELDPWATWLVGGMKVSGWQLRGRILHKWGPSPGPASFPGGGKDPSVLA